MKINLTKALWLAYALLHLLLSVWLHRDNVELGYPTWVILASVCAQAFLFAGVLLLVFLPQRKTIAPYWRWVFPVLIVELLAGIARDAVVPEDYNLITHGEVWLSTLLLSLILAAPAYYASFILADYKSR